MSNETNTTTTLIQVAGNRYRIRREEVNKSDLLEAFNRVKSDTDKLEVAIANPDLTINQNMIKQILVYLLALGRLVIALSIKVNRLEKEK